MANGFCDNCNMCRHWNGCGCTYVLGEWECSYFLREIDRENEIMYGENKPKINTIGSYSPTEQKYFHGEGYESFDEFIDDMCKSAGIPISPKTIND